MKPTAGVRVNVKAVKYSPCGKYIAYAVQNELFITLAENGDVVSKFSCIDTIDFLDWSIDSDHILCGILTRSTVEAFSLAEPDWQCRIKEGAAGIQSAVWSPTGYHILTLAEFNVKISIWSLIGRSVAYIENPILHKTDQLSFSPCGEYFAIIIGSIDNYQMAIFSTTSWTSKLILKCTGQINIPSNPLWSPNSLFLAIYDKIDLKTCKCEVYSVEHGKKVGGYQKPQNNQITAIRKISWSPNSQFLAIGCYDEEIQVLNYITWTPVMEFKHTQIIKNDECQIFQEVEIRPKNVIHELTLERPLTFTSLKKSLQPLRLPGIKYLLFSYDSQFIASCSELMPAVVWIWSLETFKLKSVVILTNAISDLKWDFKNLNLLICSKSNNVTIWQPEKPIHLDLLKFGVGENVSIQNGCFGQSSSLNCSSLCLLSSTTMYIIHDFI